MARRKVQSESLAGWFRNRFREQPEDMDKPNDAILAIWLEDHPNQKVDGRVKNAMANVKTSVRKELGLRPKKRRKKRQKAEGDRAVAAPAGTVAVAVRRGRLGSGQSALEALELEIDRCLISARVHMDRDEDMGKVVKLLRLARNEVIWIQGKA